MPRPVWPLRLFNASLFYAAGVLALGVLCVGSYLEAQRAADRLVALRLGSPAAVAIESFDASRHTGLTGEVTIRAQVDVARPLQVLFRQGTTLRRALAFPLMAVGATRSSGSAQVLGYFHADSALPQAEILDPALIMPTFETVGDFGPIVTLNGELNGPASLSRAVGDLLQHKGHSVSAALWGITPYVDGRDVALAAQRPMPGRLLWLVLGMGLLAAGLAVSQLQPLLAQRRWLEQIASAGRKRDGVSPTMETEKARARLVNLAPAPELAASREQRRFARRLIERCRRAAPFRNPG